MAKNRSLSEISPTRWIDLGMCVIGLSVTFAIVTTAYIIAVAPMQRMLVSFQSRIDSASRLSARTAELQKQHRASSLQLASSEAALTTMLARIPETPHESEFLAQITEVARECQLNIRKYHPTEPVNEGTFTAMEVQLDATASYEGVCRFLDGLRTLSRLCRLTRLRLHATEEENGELPMEMTLRIYFAPLNKSPET